MMMTSASAEAGSSSPPRAAPSGGLLGLPRWSLALAGWTLALATAAWALAALEYTTRDPDSVLHAAIVTQLAERPVSTWIAPDWPPRWYMG